MDVPALKQVCWVVVMLAREEAQVPAQGRRFGMVHFGSWLKTIEIHSLNHSPTRLDP